jgi:CRP-like cAMP-binding protein
LLQVVNQLALRNRILGALPNEEYGRIAPHLSEVTFEKDDVIYRSEDPIDFVYLPESGLISLLSTTETGSTIEVAMLGKEGVVGLPVVLKNHIIPYEVKVRFRTKALRIKAEIFQEEFDKGQVLHDFLLRYLNVMLTQISQSSICNRFHTIEATLSRWLLTVQDQTSSTTLDLTQKVISEALGVPRTGVTVAAGALQTAGAIRYSRGKIVILDRVRLESRSCECYRIIRDELDHFLNE